MGLLLFLVKTVLKLLLSTFTHTQNAPTWGVNCNYIFSNFFFQTKQFQNSFFSSFNPVLFLPSISNR